MTFSALASVSALLLLTGSALAGDAERGRQKAETCLGCHGQTGNSEVEQTPSLAGHPAAYSTVQLILFRDKLRRSEQMVPFAEGLTDDDIEDLAAYFETLKPSPPEPVSNAALAAAGKRVADANHCGSCHLPDYSGREQMPRLAGQREDYLLKALRDYKAGERPGLDGRMTEVLYHLSDQDLQAVSHYLAHLR